MSEDGDVCWSRSVMCRCEAVDIGGQQPTRLPRPPRCADLFQFGGVGDGLDGL